MKQDSLIETLQQLGLTQYEAQCYLGLLRQHPLTAEVVLNIVGADDILRRAAMLVRQARQHIYLMGVSPELVALKPDLQAAVARRGISTDRERWNCSLGGWADRHLSWRERLCANALSDYHRGYLIPFSDTWTFTLSYTQERWSTLPGTHENRQCAKGGCSLSPGRTFPTEEQGLAGRLRGSDPPGCDAVHGASP